PTCHEKSTGKKVDDSNCGTLIKPPEQQTCRDEIWVYSTMPACVDKCSDSTASETFVATYYCAETKDQSVAIPDSQCVEKLGPANPPQRTCSYYYPCPSWNPGSCQYSGSSS